MVFTCLPIVVSDFYSWNESSFGDRTINSRGSMFRVRQNRGCRSPQNFAKRAAFPFHCSIALRIASWLSISTEGQSHQNLELVQQHRATHQPHDSYLLINDRSEERRVGKECRSRW